MYVRLGVLLGLAAFLAANLAASVLVAAFAGPLARHAWLDRPLRRARLLYGLRVLPTAAAVLFSLGVILPSYVLFEPRGTTERPGLALVALATSALALIGTGLCRGLASFSATKRVVRSWMREAEQIGLRGVPASGYRVGDPCAAVSVVGTLRPKIFLSSQILAALSPGEISAALAHEAAHLRFRDNLKRLALRFWPDPLSWLPAGRRLELEWARAAETVADARAAQGDAGRALDLSAALVKVARLAPARPSLTHAASALHGGAEVAARVGRLLSGRLIPEGFDPLAAGFAVAALALVCVWSSLPLFAPEAFAGVHRLVETVVVALR